MGKPRLAVVTMVFNEEDFLPIWLRYYGRQVGRNNCFILDHGSTDSSTAQAAGASVVRLPRGPLDEEQRCRFVSDFCASLLAWFDFVAYTDVDELLVADPARHDSLASLCKDGTDVITAFGLNVIHRLGHEGELVPTGLVSRQRAWLMPLSSMCKPAIISRPVRWAPGFHSADADTVFGDLLLMHIAYADYDLALRRQRRRQSQARARLSENSHHQKEPATVARWMQDWCRMDEVLTADLGPDCPIRGAFTDQILASRAGRETARYRIDIALTEHRLWRLPPRFAGTF